MFFHLERDGHHHAEISPTNVSTRKYSRFWFVVSMTGCSQSGCTFFSTNFKVCSGTPFFLRHQHAFSKSTTAHYRLLRSIICLKIPIFLTFRRRLPVRGSGSCTDFSIYHGRWPIPPCYSTLSCLS